ncbi:CGNR zinc finger domain-containing protein [Streptomyces sp. NPDC018610]|uniref:CGNR zinc finger domain-containing protein n=1 Tax=Streptomyces sp. NPDC018610 TaxID=3365049 RepID=UPI003787B108
MTGNARSAASSPHRPEPLPPAPGEERSPALALVNTLTTRGGTPVDELDTPRRAARWLADRRLTDDGLSLDAAELDGLHRLRQAVRGLLDAAVTGRAPDARWVESVNRALSAAPVTATLAWPAGGQPSRHTRVAADRPVARALHRLADDTVSLLCGPDAEALAACPADGCARLLLRTHGRRQWCCTRCGDRVRAARHYARRRAAADLSTD